MKFSLNWFRGDENEEAYYKELLEEQKLKNEILKKVLTGEIPVEDVEKKQEKPYKKVNLVNDVITIVLNDGSVLSKFGCTVEDFKNVTLAETEEAVYKILGNEIPKEEEDEIEKEKVAYEGYLKLQDNPDFTVKDECVYLNDVPNRSIPALLAAKFGEVEKDSEEYVALKRFWVKCCLNPNAQSAEDLFTFLNKHQFKIDKHGNFYAYRRVEKIYDASENKGTVEFVGNVYNKIKAVWKKSPRNFHVWEKFGEFCFTPVGKLPVDDNAFWKNIGNLQDLYIQLPEMSENRYTDDHTHSEDYRVGRSAKMPRDKGDDNNQISCSFGYHIASKAYDYSGFGNTPVLAIVNPIDVLAVDGCRFQ